MKTLKFSTLLATLACALTFSSCLNNDSDDYGNNFRSYVTITGDEMFGYTFHSDFGCTLKPTSYSVQTVLPGLTNAVKRAIVAFQPTDETTTELHAGNTYEVNLVSDPYANYAIPTFSTINANNPVALDSLTTKNNGRISSVNSSIWAVNGYANAEIILYYNANSNTINLNTYYTPEDVDVANNTLYLNLYYNDNTTSSYSQVQSVFSFDLPEETYNVFQTDTINLVLRAKSSNHMGLDYVESELNEVGRCKLATKDLFPPMAY